MKSITICFHMEDIAQGGHPDKILQLKRQSVWKVILRGLQKFAILRKQNENDECIDINIYDRSGDIHCSIRNTHQVVNIHNQCKYLHPKEETSSECKTGWSDEWTPDPDYLRRTAWKL